MPFLVIISIQIALAIACFASAGATASAGAFALGLHALATASAWWLALTDVDRARRARDSNGRGRPLMEPLYWSHVVSLQIFALAGGIALAQGFGRMASGHAIDRLGDFHPFLAVPIAAAGLCALALPSGEGDGGTLPVKDAKWGREARGLALSSIIALVALHVASGEGDRAGQAWLDACTAVTVGIVMAMLAGITALDLRSKFVAADDLVEPGD